MEPSKTIRVPNFGGVCSSPVEACIPFLACCVCMIGAGPSANWGPSGSNCSGREEAVANCPAGGEGLRSVQGGYGDGRGKNAGGFRCMPSVILAQYCRFQAFARNGYLSGPRGIFFPRSHMKLRTMLLQSRCFCSVVSPTHVPPPPL
jgi:hypothetical protein